jgi:ACS family hexuronate transporter-like MFS transporter
MGQDQSAAEAPVPALRSTRKWWICVLLLLATTLNYMDRQALSLTGVQIKKDFHLDPQQYTYLAGLFNVGFGLGALVFGWLVDRGSLRWIYAGLVLAWSAVGFATGYVESFAPLLICRLFLGLFEAGNWPCGIMAVKRLLKPEERTLGNGMFQSGTAIGAILMPLVVMACFRWSDPGEPRVWQIPFRLIGVLGGFWVVLWLVAVKEHYVAAPPAPPGPAGPSESYWALWRDRRFYVLIVVIVGVNTPWRTVAELGPLFLQEEKHYSFEEAQLCTSAYYFAADAGSIASGLLALWLARRGRSLFTSKMVSFFFCATLTLLLLAVVYLDKGWLLFAMYMLVGFGTLGSFSTYYAFSQEVSAKHQGKVTGTLGLINAVCMGSLVLLQGNLIKITGSYATAVAATAAAPFLAMIVVWLFWKRPSPRPAVIVE